MFEEICTTSGRGLLVEKLFDMQDNGPVQPDPYLQAFEYVVSERRGYDDYADRQRAVVYVQAH